MARPGRDLSLPVTAAIALERVTTALGSQGFATGQVTQDGSTLLTRGRTAVGVAVEAVSEIVPLWLLPGGRKHMFAFSVRIRTLADAPTECTLRLELERKGSAPVVDHQFESALAQLHAALESQGLTCVWGAVTDAARDSDR